MGICKATKHKIDKISKKDKNENKSIENYDKLIVQDIFIKMNKSLCKLIIKSNKDQSYDIGFFMNIKLDKNIKCLKTNYGKITQNLIKSEETIIIQLKNEKIIAIKLDIKRRFIKYLNQFYNITIIEILVSDFIGTDIEILDYDLDYVGDYQEYLNKKILILDDSLNNKNFLFGKIINLKELRF